MSPKREEDDYRIGGFQPVPLFLERVSAYWTYVFKCWRVAFDWTVVLYLVIPGLLFAGGTYREWLLYPPDWMSRIPAAMPLAAAGVLCGIGRFRTFAESGDGLLLNRIRKWTRTFTVLGLGYAFVSRLLIASCAILLLLPLWRNKEGIGLASLPLLIAAFAVWGTGILLLQDQISRRWSGWMKTLLSSAVRTGFAAMLAGVAWKGAASSAWWAAFVGAGVLFTAVMWRIRLRARGTFLHELLVEKDAFLAAISWMLVDTMDRKPLPKLSRPVLLSRSPALFRQREAADRLAESWIKSLLRRFDNVRLLLFFAGLGVAAVLLVPVPLSFAVWLMLPTLLLAWLQGQWKYWLSEDFISQFRWEDSVIGRAGEIARFWLAIPAVCLWAAAIGLRLGFAFGGPAWLAAAVVPAAGWFWLRAVNRIATEFTRFKRPRARVQAAQSE